MLVFWTILGILAYSIIGVITYKTFVYLNIGISHNLINDENVGATFAGIFWPFGLLGLVVVKTGTKIFNAIIKNFFK